MIHSNFPLIYGAGMVIGAVMGVGLAAIGVWLINYTVKGICQAFGLPKPTTRTSRQFGAIIFCLVVGSNGTTMSLPDVRMTVLVATGVAEIALGAFYLWLGVKGALHQRTIG